MGEAGIAIFAIAMVFGLPILFVLAVGFVIVMVIRAGKKSSSTTQDEAQLIQEIHHGLKEMDRRVEVLETILLDRTERQPSELAKRERY